MARSIKKGPFVDHHLQSKVEAASQGKKLPPAAQADVDRYNSLLNQYLGARCHV
jgi:ribosomal protein S19